MYVVSQISENLNFPYLIKEYVLHLQVVDCNLRGKVCDFLNLPIYLDSRLFCKWLSSESLLHFQNRFCRECWKNNQDGKNYQEDEIYLRLSQEIRECIPNLKECNVETSTFNEVEKCQSYQYPIIPIQKSVNSSKGNVKCYQH